MPTARFLIANGALIAVQAALVALPGRGIPAPLRRAIPRVVALPVALAAVIAVIALEARLAQALTWLALFAVPALAAVALGWAARGARPALGLLALPLLALAIGRTGAMAGDAAAAALTALSCVTLGRLLAGTVPATWLKTGIVAIACLDAVTVFGHPLHTADAIVAAAVPSPGLPRLQYLDLHAASLGYADVFVAALLGGLLAAERRPQSAVALLTLGLSIAWDAWFLAIPTVPATVPVAAAMLVAEAVARRAPSIRAPTRDAAATAAPPP